ncbi:hypothetical protein LDDCCGHA_5040 [Methylobacterium oxalidis]|nr:hypothetical protein LDDCCGHA_5040 [Methylobacterium oxalidis]
MINVLKSQRDIRVADISTDIIFVHHVPITNDLGPAPPQLSQHGVGGGNLTVDDDVKPAEQP